MLFNGASYLNKHLVQYGSFLKYCAQNMSKIEIEFGPRCRYDTHMMWLTFIHNKIQFTTFIHNKIQFTTFINKSLSSLEVSIYSNHLVYIFNPQKKGNKKVMELLCFFNKMCYRSYNIIANIIYCICKVYKSLLSLFFNKIY